MAAGLSARAAGHARRRETHSRSARSAPSLTGPVPVTVVAHPLIEHFLTELRDARTVPEEFRHRLGHVAALMVYEATRSFQTRTLRVRTPLAFCAGAKLRHEIVIVPILRAGLGMLEPILQLIPQARVGFLGMQRHHLTLQAMIYHKSLPADLGSSEIVVIDPMLATGGSALAALRLLGDRGARRLRLVSLVAAPEGIARVQQQYPELPIFTAAVDAKLNRRGYIVPGLGDAGDRLFGV
jgi:uracil phosphoribosyltransferase